MYRVMNNPIHYLFYYCHAFYFYLNQLDWGKFEVEKNREEETGKGIIG